MVVLRSVAGAIQNFIMSRRQTFLQSFRCALRGVCEVFETQRNARIHAGCALAAVLAAIALDFDPASWAILVVIIGLVLVAEAFNTAMEAAVDLASPDLHPLARRAKDTAAGGVLIAAAISVVGGLLLFGPPLLQLVLGP